MNIVLFLIIVQLLISGCIKEKNNESLKVNLIQINSNCDETKVNEKCLEKFPQIKGPYTFEEKTKAIFIIGKYFCLAKKNNFNVELKELVIKEFIEEGVDLELINSYEVIKTANKFSELINNSCSGELYDNENLLKIIKGEIY